jgi:methionine synthase II (cobalamin-independent)
MADKTKTVAEKTATEHVPFRADFVGSFLRPERLKRARADYATGALDDAGLEAQEDSCIDELIAHQKAAGLHAITDGEFRRSWWHLDFFWGLNGIEKAAAPGGYPFHGETTRAETAVIAGPISGEDHPFVDHFRYVKAHEEPGVVAKQTIPAPIQCVAELRLAQSRGQNAAIYDDDEAVVQAVVAAYRQVISDLYDAGCRNLQLDDCTWDFYMDRGQWDKFGLDEEKVKAGSADGVRINDLALESIPSDLTVTTHVCRGNYHSHYASEGGYDLVAPHLFAHEKVVAFYLEYDDPRSGGFEPLSCVPAGTKVVLGLVTTKRPDLEDADAIKRRIAEAARYVPLDDLCLSPQCGFASTEEGNQLTEEDQWAKIALVRKVASEVWPDA